MKSTNRVELKGVIGQDARINSLDSGKKVANFSLVTEFFWVDKSGTQVKDTDWHNIVAWSTFGIADFSKLTKGTRVLVVGRLHTRNYTDKQGNPRYITEIIADELDIIDEQPRQHTGGTSFKKDNSSKPNNDEF